MSRYLFLFYKIIFTSEDKTEVEFRRLQSGVISDALPDDMRDIVVFHGEFNAERITRFIKDAGWRGSERAYDANSEMGKAVLAGRW